MKKLAAVLVLVAALAAVTAFAQANRWEYATLLFPWSGDATPIFTAPGVTLLGYNPATGNLSRDAFFLQLRRYAGAPRDHDETGLAALLSLLGLQRWELVLIEDTKDERPHSWFIFKRPLLE